MVVWIFAVSVAGIFFWSGDVIVAYIFSGPLGYDTFGFVHMMVEFGALVAKYVVPIFVLILAYNLRSWQALRFQAVMDGAPRCYRCGRTMVFRTVAYGLIFWEHYWGCPRCRAREEVERW